MNAQNPHPGVSPGFDSNRSLQTEAFFDALVEQQLMMLSVGSGVFAPQVPAAALASRTAAERLAFRSLNFALDPRGGPIKGFVAGFSNGLLFGEAAPEIPSVNRGFDRGAAFGQPTGEFFRSLFQLGP